MNWFELDKVNSISCGWPNEINGNKIVQGCMQVDWSHCFLAHHILSQLLQSLASYKIYENKPILLVEFKENFLGRGSF